VDRPSSVTIDYRALAVKTSRYKNDNKFLLPLLEISCEIMLH